MSSRRYGAGVSPPLPLLTRLWFAWACFFRVLVSGDAARRVWSSLEGEAPAAAPSPPPEVPRLPPAAPPATEVTIGPALQLLALLQREGRLVDFLEQDITAFSDADVGVAARVVHAGCRKALRAHATLGPVRTEEEGTTVTVKEGFADDEIKLSGNVKGEAPFTGVLRHRGWRATGLALPTVVRAYDQTVIAPAEVEL